MSVCLSLRETRENGTFVKLQHILMILNILYILCDIMLFGLFCACLSILVMIFRLLTKIHQNQFFLYFYGFKLFVLYNLVLCYSLHPVLVIWHVTLIIFLQIQVFFSKLQKVSFGKSKLGYVNVG